MTRLGDFLREGAADVFGFGGELEQLRETAADARMLSRAVEDAGFGNLGGGSTGSESYFDPPRESRIATVRRAYRYFFDDVIVRRSVLLMSNYVFSKGISIPRYRRKPGEGDSDPDYDRATQRISDFWYWPENKRVLTTHKAQKMKQIELMVQANVFIALFRQEGSDDSVISVGGEKPTGDGIRPRPTLVLSNVKDREIVEIIGHPDNDTLPVFYKRVWTPRKYDFKTSTGLGVGAYTTDTKQMTRFYRDWENEAPTEFEGQPWGPDPALIADGVIYHISTNLVSDMKFGISELRSVLKWSTGLNQFMSSRMMISQAIAALALQAKTKGGPQAVSQLAAQFSDISRLAGQVEGGSAMLRNRADQGRTKVAVSSSDVELQPMVQDTGAAGAQTDASIIMGQAAAGTGVAKQHLGVSDQPSLATAVSLDLPTQRGAEDWQEGWERAVLEIVGYMLEGEGLDPSQLEVEMPPILSRDVAQVSATLTALMATVDPNGSNRSLIRWIFLKVVEAMGDPNPQQVVDDLFPEDFDTPFMQQQQMMAQQAAAAGGDTSGMAGGPDRTGPGGHDEPASTPTQNGAGKMMAAATTALRGSTQGIPQGLNQPGGQGASLQRAAQRIALQMTSPGQGFTEAEFIEAAFADLDDVPDELRAAALEAYESVAALVDD